ncbi:MAG: cytochrome c biogenesis protein CcsA [Candidatus Thermoplasmatota archaeon]
MAEWLMVLSFLSITGALALIVHAFTSLDFSVLYVWEHSSSDLDPLYRLSAVWAGGGGSLLLCTWFISLSWLISSAMIYQGNVSAGKQRPGARFASVSSAIMSVLVAFFAFTVLMSGVFDKTPAASLAANPDGLGLDTLLQSPEMVLHAPLILGAYAALCSVFASSAAHLVTGDRHWHRVSLPWGRFAWVTLTAGIGLGAVWAYYVIGWGGYWSWDPVETASLVPWLMVTAFLHTQQRQLQKEEYPVASPMFGMLSLVGVVFVSFVVRAGGLWSSSVHDYGASSESSAVARLALLLSKDPSVAGVLVFMLALLAASLILSFRASRRLGPSQPVGAPPRLSGYVTDRNNMFAAVVLIALSASVAVALMLKTVGSDAAATYAELDQKMTALFVALMVALALCMAWRLVGRERALPMVLALVVASAVLAAVAAWTGAVDGAVAFALPSCCLVIVASSVRLAQTLSKGPGRSRAYRAGAQVAHIGVALLIAAFVVSSNMQSYPAQGPEVALGVGGQVSVGDYVVEFVRMDFSYDVDGRPAGVTMVRTAYVDIYEGERLVQVDVPLEVLYGGNEAAGYYELERVAFVDSSISGDLYLSYAVMSYDVILLHAKVVPAMWALWAGALLLISGMAVRMWAFGPTEAASREDA